MTYDRIKRKTGNLSNQRDVSTMIYTFKPNDINHLWDQIVFDDKEKPNVES